MKTIRISTDFSNTPWARYKTDGEFSGEAFYEDILKPRFQELWSDERLSIDLDGVYWYPSSFLSESFWHLYKDHGNSIWEKIEFISNDDPLIIDVIKKLALKYE